MPGVAIVAIPKEDDTVWKYSSEKVPHLTILYLGENVQNLDQIALFVEHAAKTSLNRFGLTVDRRGTLGSDNADVLFFEKEYPLCDKVKDFRSNLLGNKDVEIAYNSVEQYPEWTPHLTMGFPESPAKKDDRDYPGFHYVEFDKIAIWTGDSEGPTFDLESEPHMDSLSMSEKLDNFLAHFGVRGMRWGVRRTDAQLGNPGGGKNGVKSPSGVDVDPSKATEITLRLTRKQQDKLEEAGFERAKKLDISDDAVRFVQTLSKENAALTTKEINEALKRAEAVAKYDEHFRKDAHDLAVKEAAAAQARIELAIKETSLKNAQFDLAIKEANFRKANAPKSKLAKARDLIKNVVSAYDAYDSLNQRAGGKLPDPLAEFRRAAKQAGVSGTTKKARKDAAEEFKRSSQERKEKRKKSKAGKSKTASTPTIIPGLLTPAEVKALGHADVSDFITQFVDYAEVEL